MSDDAIFISSIPSCLPDLKDGIEDLDQLSHSLTSDQPDGLFTEDDFDFLMLADPAALSSFESFSSMKGYVDRYVADHMADPACQQEFGRSVDPFAIWLSEIPPCMSDLRQEFIQKDERAQGYPSDGRITADEFKKLRRLDPEISGFESFRKFAEFIKGTVESRMCDAACVDAGAMAMLENAICVAPQPPEPPEPKSHPKRPAAEEPKIAKAEPPKAAPQPMELEGPPRPEPPHAEGEDAIAAAQVSPSPPLLPSGDVDLARIKTELAWSLFEKMYGEDRLAMERDEYERMLKDGPPWFRDLRKDLETANCEFTGWDKNGLPRFTFRNDAGEERMWISFDAHGLPRLTERPQPLQDKFKAGPPSGAAGSECEACTAPGLVFSFNQTFDLQHEAVVNSMKMYLLRRINPHMDAIRDYAMQGIVNSPNTYRPLLRELMSIRRSESISLAEQRRRIFELWDKSGEMAGDADKDWNHIIGHKARRIIVDFVEQHYPKKSPYGYTEMELAGLNANRESSQPFTPYA